MNNRLKVTDILIIQETLLVWGKENYSNFPWRSTENAFHGLLAEVLLQRTRAEQVIPVYLSFAKRFPTVKDTIGKDAIINDLLKPLGLKWRAQKVVELMYALKLLDEKVPESMAGLLELPGVGNYAASAFITFHTNSRALIIDSNTVRLWCRVFNLPKEGEVRRKKWFNDLVDEITPIENHRAFNYAVLDHSKALCKKTPSCSKCPIGGSCHFHMKQRQS